MLGFGATDSDRVAAESKRTQRHGTEIQSIVVCGHGHGSTAQQCGAAAPYAAYARPLLLWLLAAMLEIGLKYVRPRPAARAGGVQNHAGTAVNAFLAIVVP